MEIYRKSACEREAQRKFQLEERRKRAWAIARQAAEILKRDFRASRVVVFGSLIHPERFHSGSDVDLAVWDIQQYFRAVSVLIDIDPEISFDLIPAEDASPRVLAIILQEGIEL